MMNGIGWGGMWFGPLFWLLILGAIVLGVVVLVHNSRTRDQRDHLPPYEDALEILKKRYARGKITKEQFERMKQDLQY
jgi:putative membrane protein